MTYDGLKMLIFCLLKFIRVVCPLPRKLRLEKDCGGFSLVEVTLALGIVSFAMIPLLGFMTISLRNGDDSSNRTRAIESIRLAEGAIKSQQLISTTPTVSFQLGSPLKSNGSSITWTPNGDAATYEFAVGESGEILSAGTGRVVLHIQLIPPKQISGTTLFAEPLRVYLTAAWPASAHYDAAKGWLNAGGFVESIFYLPCNR